MGRKNHENKGKKLKNHEKCHEDQNQKELYLPPTLYIKVVC